jgi:hypothetical protein
VPVIPWYCVRFAAYDIMFLLLVYIKYLFKIVLVVKRWEELVMFYFDWLLVTAIYIFVSDMEEQS